MVRGVGGGRLQFHRLSIHGESVVQGGRGKRPAWRAEFGVVAPWGVDIEGRCFLAWDQRPE